MAWRRLRLVGLLKQVLLLATSRTGHSRTQNKKVFEPFFTSKADDIGLSIAHDYRGERRADMGKKSRSRRRDV
jgi:C4-dicarboxylate-specific signal transduction histidine kinase